MKSAILLIALCLVGCTNLPERVSAPITEGMTRHEVRERMGKPQKRFVTSDGEVWIYRGGEEVLYFRKQPASRKGRSSSGRRTRVARAGDAVLTLPNQRR